MGKIGCKGINMNNGKVSELALYRYLKRLTQREVAKAAGINPALLCMYERGKRRVKPAVLEHILATIENLEGR